jgi:hypothetical protein
MKNLTSFRTKENKVSVSFFAEDMLRYILGSYYNHLHGAELSERQWKHILKKLLSKIEWAIENNLYTDGIHKKKIDFQLNCLKQSVEDKDNTDPEIVIALISLCFELIGSLPDNRDRLHANKKGHFKLSRRRSIQYIQYPRQKVSVIIDSSWYEPFKDFYTYNDILSKFALEFSNNALNFLSWYKAEYPKLYAMLF